MRLTSSSFVVAELQPTKNRFCWYVAVMAGLCSNILARELLPMPPAPKMAILGVLALKRSSISETSDSRPWKIFGSDGSMEMEMELEDKI
jgi:hypothetical protein